MSQSARLRPRSLLIVGVVFFAGCATSAPLTGGLSTGPSIGNGGGRGDALSGSPAFKVAQLSSVSVPLAEAWTRLAKVYSDLAIPLTVVSPQDHVLGNQGMKRSHTFANERLSSLFDCGSGQGGANADMYSINMSVMTRLRALSDSTTEIATLVRATATPMSFGTPPVECGTNGWLEAKVASMVSGAALNK